MMKTNRTALQERARRHMQDALAQGWSRKSLMCDYAQAALEAEGYDETNAADAVEIAWDRHFEITPPV